MADLFPSTEWLPTLRSAREDAHPSQRYDVHPTLPGRCVGCGAAVSWAFGAWWDTDTQRHACPEPNGRSRDVPYIIGRSGSAPRLALVRDEHGAACYITTTDGRWHAVPEVR